MFFVGSVTGTLILGILADMFGRLPMLAVANLLAITGNILTVYVKPTIWLLGLARFIAGLATDTNFFMMYIIGKFSFKKNNISFINFQCQINDLILMFIFQLWNISGLAYALLD